MQKLRGVRMRGLVKPHVPYATYTRGGPPFCAECLHAVDDPIHGTPLSNGKRLL